MTAERPPTRSTLERALGLVTEVRAGEGVTALLLALNVFVLLTAYYVIKPVREGLILELEAGAEYKSYLGGAIAVLLLLVVPAYARFASRVPPRRLVVTVTLFFASHLLVFYVAANVPTVRVHLGLVFYVWVGIFNMMVVAQFWAFANDLYTAEQGKRLFPLVGVGASVGAPLGSQIAESLAVPLGKMQLLVVSAGLLASCALLFHAVARRERDALGRDEAPDRKGETTPTAPEGAFEMVWRHRYLGLLAAFSLVFTFVNTNGEYVLSKLFKKAATEAVAAGVAADVGDYLTAAYAGFFKYVNLAGAFLQLFVVSRIVKYTGFRTAFLVLPVIALLGATGAALFPVLALVRLTKTAENSTDYSLNNTLRNMLWLPTTREMKYRAKQAVDTFFVRMGDVSSALLVALGAGMLGWSLRAFAVVNVVLVLGWLALALAIARHWAKMTDS